MRPRHLAELVGQRHLLDPGRPLWQAIDGRQPHSMILWGPPGTGKTTLARLVATAFDGHFVRLSAVLAGVKEVRAAVETARAVRAAEGRDTLLFLDEVHRFNKAQQDALLPHLEDGTLWFIGATTENPSFELNNALLSRTRVYVLKALEPADLELLIERALTDADQGLGALGLCIDAEARGLLALAADGDARRVLGLLELAADLATDGHIDRATVEPLLVGGTRRFDKGGDAFYDQISALHKSVRGSAPDAALYWLARMLDGGCDPRYIARRLIRMASEDIGNADPRALTLALEAAAVWERMGSPEGDLALAQAAVYLACAAKSNAVYTAWHAAVAEVRAGGSLPVPERLRNAPTGLTRALGHGAGYRYAHDEPEAYAAGEHYFPDELPPRRYYDPVPRGLEIRIGEKLARLRAMDAAARAGDGVSARGLAWGATGPS